MGKYIGFSNYTPAADIVVTAICLVMIVLVSFSYIKRNRNSQLFLKIVILLLIAAWVDITFYMIAPTEGLQLAANWLRCIYHGLLCLIFTYYVAYICEVTKYEKSKIYITISNVIFITVLIADIIATAQGITFHVTEDGISFVRRGIFIYGYLAYNFLCIVLLIRVRKLIFHRIMFGFYGTLVISFLLLFVQGISNQSSFTVTALMLPAIATLYILHSNPYDAMLGTNDEKSMQDYVRQCYEKKRDFMFSSLYLREFDEEGKDIPLELQNKIREYVYKQVKGARLFKVNGGHLILCFETRQNPDYEQIIKALHDKFFPIYNRYRFDYRVVVGESLEEISRKNEYVNFIRTVQKKMPECSAYRVGPEDLAEFKRREYILKELIDINRCSNLDDPRVLVYCQPVLNVKTGRYDTGEALMRLELKETGIVYPDQFIHLAEEQGYIHILTKIILHKTCEAIWQFIHEGYDIKRISVNVSMSEVKDEGFCRDIIDIINNSSVPGGKIAIEITESQNEGDFMLMKRKIGELREQGIKLYLDDFGTGYSSMERIMELPFDIIKFDRSLVLESEASERPRMMVENLANMFTQMGYDVLYEGVETDSDETMCRDMAATYLQGFKYSKPRPIMEIKEFLSKAE